MTCCILTYAVVFYMDYINFAIINKSLIYVYSGVCWKPSHLLIVSYSETDFGFVINP